MALVRCPKHDIPYNDENPRGCPACAQERQGRDSASIMRELARASTSGRRSSGMQTAKILEEAAEQLAAGFPPVAAEPLPSPSLVERLRTFVQRRPYVAGAIAVVLVALSVMVALSGPRFVEQPDPPPATGDPRPLALEPGAAVPMVFAILGVQPPRTHPEAPALERYAYGTDLTVDALNGAVYAITLRVPTWTWRGLRVGMTQRNAEGTLALLGPPREVAATTARADTVAGYLAYPSLDRRPTRTLRAEVRPPNGCLDASVELKPRAAGVLVDGDLRYAAIGPPQVTPEWVATAIVIVNRAVAGPAGAGAC
ncbi:MAG TPA: hypothetical protein VD793_02165 [Gemmatimonadales bacterium]|nr:hypothetical protein [Gemmatimonadales bacterium]